MTRTKEDEPSWSAQVECQQGAAPAEWAFVPASDLLLLLGEGDLREGAHRGARRCARGSKGVVAWWGTEGEMAMTS